MIGTEFIKGQGLGNQLFCYVTARAIAEELGYEFGCAGVDHFAVNIHSDKGMYFMDMDLGHEITEEEKRGFGRFEDAEVRLFVGNSKHDLEHGCYVAGEDASIHSVPDNTLLYGNLQAESYFIKYRDRLKDWLKVKEEYESYAYSRENLCVINMRGGEYTGNPELYIDKKYWINGMEEMKKLRADMEFIIVTDDVEAAQKMLPGIPAYHFDIAKDYVTIKNAYYLLLSNSSFACLPAYTSDTLRFAIAPKYWARYNVSDGYWASEQNIYSLFHYMDRKGRIFTAEECRKELAEFKEKSVLYRRVNQRPKGLRKMCAQIKMNYIYSRAWALRIMRSIERRLKKKLGR